ncbi:hypothetical protein QE152_g26446 [Popillia japonica]|uniref:Uncharacterized protein n=1 Tax=Popillia japonica TaxID=7064 RepID=A0AAW1JYI3_POPJA
MPSSAMAKNYSHCPLKKRPVQLIEEEDSNSDEPENLSTKPEDLSRTGRYNSKSPETISPHSSPASTPPISSPSPPHYIYPHIKSETVFCPTPISPEYAPQTWHRSIVPVYPPSYPYHVPYSYHEYV